MKYTKAMRAAKYFRRMESLGFSYEEADRIRLIEKTLSRWSALECGDSNNHASWAIERDEAGKPFMVYYYHNQTQPDSVRRRRKIADREAGALRRLQAIMTAHPDLWFYRQSDPRGCAVYIGRNTDLQNGAGLVLPVDSYYTRGVAACID
jgi:hypothetical protein